MSAGKKGVFVLLVVMLFVQGVFAALNVDEIPASVYNFGDKVMVSGSVAHTADLRGYVGIGFVCGTKKMQTTSSYVDLKANEAQGFSQLITVPQGLDGSCTVQVTLSDVQGNSVDAKNAGSVTITDVLEGNFQEIPQSFQLGDKLVIKGRVQRQDKSGVDGLATIYFKQNQESVFIESAPIAQGEMNYVKDLNLVPAGSYALDIAVADSFGNKNLFADLYRLSLNNNIDFDITLDKKQYAPGEGATISGIVKSTVQSKLANVEVELIIDGNAQAVKLEDNTKPFLFRHMVARDAKAGDHSVKVSAKDSTGNFGEKEVPLNVKAQPTLLTLKLAGESVVPDQNIVFETSLADQAGDPMAETVVAKLVNQKKEFEKSKLVQTQGQDFFIVPQGGLPGLWRVELDGFGLFTGKSFAVKEHKAVHAELDGEVLLVKNVGNVRFDEALAVRANDLEASKKLRLGLGVEARVSLNQLFEPGTYAITIPATGQTFENVVVQEKPGLLGNLASSFGDVTGNVVANVSMPGRQSSLAVLFVIILVSLAVVLRPKGEGHQRIEVKQSRHGLRDFLSARKNARELRKERVSRGRAYRPEFGHADEQDVADFKERMQKVWDEHQEREKQEKYKSSFSYRPSPKREDEKPQQQSNSEGNIFDAFK